MKVNVALRRNPTYTGRFELPDNLKPMFRPIAMMIPHYSLIGEGTAGGRTQTRSMCSVQ